MAHLKQRLLLVVLSLLAYGMIRTIIVRLANRENLWLVDGLVLILCLLFILRRPPKNRL